jgi:hypothetical protein
VTQIKHQYKNIAKWVRRARKCAIVDFVNLLISLSRCPIRNFSLSTSREETISLPPDAVTELLLLCLDVAEASTREFERECPPRRIYSCHAQVNQDSTLIFCFSLLFWHFLFSNLSYLHYPKCFSNLAIITKHQSSVRRGITNVIINSLFDPTAISIPVSKTNPHSFRNQKNHFG